MKSTSIILFFLLLSHLLQAQSLSINTDGSTASSSALLDVKSTTRGLLIPRLTKAQKNAIPTPATSLLIYQTGPDSTGFYYYQNSQWNWITDNKKSDSSYWGLHGNNNTTPPAAANNAPINYATDTYLGTFQPEDVSFVAGGNELVRLKQVSQGGLIGFSNRNPEYGLDMRLSDPNPQSDIVGMRIISSQLFDLNNSVNLNKGLVIGNNRSNANETVIWNHGNNLDASIRIGFDLFGSSVRPALSLNQYGAGIYQRTPHYALDIHSMSQFAPATNVTNKNGVRITYPGQETQPDEVKGLFMGVGNNSFKSYLWNYADGSGSNSPDRAIYFGVGGDMDYNLNRATMEMQDGKIIMGRITDPNFFFPATLNIQTDYASGVAKNGMSIMKHLVNGAESAYFGTDNNDNLNIYKYGGGNILLGSPLEIPITINASNFVGIRTLTPNAEMQFGDTYANNKIVLHNNFWGNFPNNEHNFYGFGVNADVLRYQVPKVSTDHVFYSGNTAGTASVELMRITGDGFVGINNNNPLAPLQFATGPANRKIVLSASDNSDHNFLGFGNSTDGGLRYQIPFGNYDHVFYKGDNGGFSSTELMKLKGTGELGIGITSPSFRLEVNGRMRIHSGGSNASSAGIWFNNNANNTNTGFVGMESDNAIGFYGTGTPNGWGVVMNIATGNVGIGTSGPTQKLHVIGNILATGTITPSDYRYKKNIHPLENALAKLQQLNGVTYEMNRQAFPEWNFEDTRQYGLIAQEVEKIFPEMVKTIDTKGYKGVDYVKLIPVLLEGIKEQQKQIEILKEQNLQQQLQIESILKIK
jgi:hypothetical protein